MEPGLLTGPRSDQRGFRRIVTLLIALVTVPSAFLLAVGILMLVFYQVNLNLLFGILVVVLVGCVVTGIVLALVFLRREANLSQLQTDFVSKVSHELRTPLTSIRMFVDTLRLKRTSTPEELDACIDVLGRETERLTERIERLLDWGRMEAGKRVYDRNIEDPAEIARSAISAFETATMGRSTPIELRLAPQLPRFNVDRAALVDAIVNLLSNAYKYTGPEKHIALHVEADKTHVRIAVHDNGIGIPRREHGRVFQKFYRVDERLARDVEGSGLGLAIVRHIARGHGGRVELTSEPKKGSTFTLVIPTVGAN